jgi:CBS domain-containing protein
MTAVADILKSKTSSAVHTIAPTDSVLDALRLMADKGIGALLVMEGGDIAGIVTERDYARKIALLGRTSGATLISIGDLVKDIISEQKFIIEQLEHYISGRH